MPQDLNGLTIVMALATFVIVVVSSVSMPEANRLAGRFSDPIARTFLCIWTLGALPIAFAMPRKNLGFGQS